MSNVLITSPSLYENDNVSGISTIVRSIIHKDSANKYFHFRLGKKDNQKKNFKWFFDQCFLLPLFVGTIIKNKIQIVHLNTGFEKPAILRDFFIFLISKYIFNVKVLFHAHGGYLLMQPPSQNSIFYKMIRKILTGSKAVIVLSKLECDKIKETYAINSIVLPNAIDVYSFNYREANAFNEKLNFVFLGRIVRSKGIFLIADVFKKLNNRYNEFTFSLYGVGSNEEEFSELLTNTEGLNYKRCEVVSGDEKWEALKKSHVFLLPSIYGEGLPIAMLEAMACGCVCIVSDDGSIATTIKNEVNGVLINKNQEQQLYDAICYVLDNRQLLLQLSNNAVDTIKNEYSFESYITNLNQIYTGLINDKKKIN